ncbi:hypothetical protein M409DRAFT_53615 [Zasmidium cellare ATCC 36951]|uniref:Uncharacterized protein n=1 Tax=Zasmidium cellare ATCC 36951 TaxID=1080233 RepID=A0A6A6CRC4_ZASCE|nr:uncharacterized protein M409DRAFT_53615 [Zasmidium cellare ATCC 36951]KAF2168339.1 hypothetical protein M409DRAFT_53615 [Zasmidium cellare ATCC 36951]
MSVTGSRGGDGCCSAVGLGLAKNRTQLWAESKRRFSHDSTQLGAARARGLGMDAQKAFWSLLAGFLGETRSAADDDVDDWRLKSGQKHRAAQQRRWCVERKKQQQPLTGDDPAAGASRWGRVVWARRCQTGSGTADGASTKARRGGGRLSLIRSSINFSWVGLGSELHLWTTAPSKPRPRSCCCCRRLFGSKSGGSLTTARAFFMFVRTWTKPVGRVWSTVTPSMSPPRPRPRPLLLGCCRPPTLTNSNPMSLFFTFTPSFYAFPLLTMTHLPNARPRQSPDMCAVPSGQTNDDEIISPKLPHADPCPTPRCTSLDSQLRRDRTSLRPTCCCLTRQRNLRMTSPVPVPRAREIAVQQCDCKLILTGHLLGVPLNLLPFSSDEYGAGREEAEGAIAVLVNSSLPRRHRLPAISSRESGQVETATTFTCFQLRDERAKPCRVGSRKGHACPLLDRWPRHSNYGDTLKIRRGKWRG